jgi:hypothetical protein
MAPPNTALSAKSIGPLAFHSALAFALLVALAPPQFPIDLGDLFHMLLKPCDSY